MKKTLLFLLLIVFAFGTKAQTVVFSDNFDDQDISDWRLVDQDGDGNNWSVIQMQDSTGNPIGTPLLRSFSWLNNALHPDNWAISPAIDLSAYAGQTVTLNWEVQAADPDWDLENYTVYVGNSDDTTVLQSSTTTFSETTLDGVNTLTPRSLDISAFAGQANVRFAFRHYNVSDQFSIEVDNVSVVVGTAGVNNELLNSIKVYPTQVVNTLNINSENTIKNVQIFDLTGKTIKNINADNNILEIDLSDLSSGYFFVKITTEVGSISKKILKE